MSVVDIAPASSASRFSNGRLLVKRNFQERVLDLRSWLWILLPHIL